MREIKTTINIGQLSCIFILILSTFPVIDYYCRWYITSIPMIVLILALSNNKKAFSNVVIYVSCFLMFLLLQYWGVYRDRGIVMTIINGLIVCSPGIVAIYLHYFEGNEFKKSFIQLCSIFLMITSITTIIGLQHFPNASRELASGNAIYYTTKYTLSNIGGYEFIYSLVVYIPIGLWLIFNTIGFRKVVNVFSMICIIYCIFESQYTIALISAAIILVVFLLLRVEYNRRKGIIVVSVIFMLVMCAVTGSSPFGMLSKVFLFFSEIMPFDYVSDRLLQVSQLFSGVTIHTSTTTARIDHYMVCLTSFSASPIFGNNIISFSKEFISGHSTILDILSGLGIVGGIIVFVLFKSIYKNTIKFENSHVTAQAKACWIAMIIVSILNPCSVMSIYLMMLTCCLCVQDLTISS